MTDTAITLMPGDNLTIHVPGTQPTDTAPAPGQDATSTPETGDQAPDVAPDGTPTDPAAEPDGSPDAGGVVEADNSPSGVSAG